MPRDKLKRKKIAFESIAWPTGDNEVSRIVCPAPRARKDVIEGGGALIEMRRAVYTPLPAVAQCGAAHRAFERGMDDTASAKFDEVSRP